MQKLKHYILDKLVEERATSAEIDFIIYLSRYQNDYGIVKGVYYKDMCSDLRISHQTFYDLKSSLVEKGIISTVKSNYTDWDIKIIGNDFSSQDSFKEGYLNTNHDIFYNKEFFKMKANEKLITMLLLKICFSGRGSYNIGVNNFYEKFTTLFNVSRRVIQNYIHTIRKFFSIGVKEHQYWITPLVRVYRKTGSVTETDNYNQHFGKTICRRNKVKYTKQTLSDTVTLLKQYRSTFKERLEVLEELLVNALTKSIEKANVSIKNQYKWDRNLQPKLVHSILKKEMSEHIF